NYGFNLTYRQIPTPGQCIPIFEEQLKALSEVQSKLKEFLERGRLHNPHHKHRGEKDLGAKAQKNTGETFKLLS
ncbi:uncharacterized protein VP01_13150g1, partial [Puccinia sorghi]